VQQQHQRRGDNGGGLSDVEGCLLFVYNINGFLTHLVVWRNGTPEEMAAKFIGGRSTGGEGGGAGSSGTELPGVQQQRQEGDSTNTSSSSTSHLQRLIAALQRALARLHVSGPPARVRLPV